MLKKWHAGEMQTIPTTWKRDATDESKNLNCRGTPVYFMRITLVSGAMIRLSTKTAWFYEEGGQGHYYESCYALGISNIAQRIILSRNTAGGYSEQNGLTLNLSNISRNNETFLEKYSIEWDDLVNAKVEVWISFYEIIDPLEQWYPSEKMSIANGLQLFHGRISHYKNTITTATIIVEDRFQQNEATMPITVDEFNRRYNAGWTPHEKHVNDVIPFNVGDRYFPTKACYYYDATNLRFSLATGFPSGAMWGTGDYKVYVWDSDASAMIAIDNTFYVHLSKIAGMQPIRIKSLELTPEELNQWAVVDADSITQQEPPATAASQEGALNDRSVYSENELISMSDNNMFAWVGNGALGFYVWTLLWRLTFKKKSFPQDEPFNAYILSDLAQLGNTGGGLFSVRFDPNVSGWLSPEINAVTGFATVSRQNYGTSVMLWANCPKKVYTLAQHPRNNNILSLRLESDGDSDDIPANGFTLDVDVRRDNSTPVTATMSLHECGIFVVKLLPQVRYFVKGDHGYDSVEEILDRIVINFLKLPNSTCLQFSYFKENYEISGQVSKRQTVSDFLRSFSEQIGMIYVETTDSKMRFIDIYGGISLMPKDKTLTDRDILLDSEGVPRVTVSKEIRNVYSKFEILYAKAFGSGEYMRRRYVTPNDNNWSVLTAAERAEAEGYCYEAESKYGTEKMLSVKCDWADASTNQTKTAEYVLYKLAKWFTYKPDIVHIMASLRRLDVEIGDNIELNLTNYAPGYMFLVIGKEINTKASTIDFTLLQCRWTP